MFSDTRTGAQMRAHINTAQLAAKLAADPGYDFFADPERWGDAAVRDALHLRDAAQGLCANVTPREADVWAPKNRPVTCHGKPVLRNGRKVWARYLLKPQRTSRKERALLEGDLTRFAAIDDLDRALNAGEITNEQHAHRLNELGSERLTGVTTTHSQHVDVHHETADDEPVLMGDRRSNSLLDAERAQYEEVRWLNGFYVMLLAEEEGWGEDPTHQIELSPAKRGVSLKVGRHQRHDPRVEQLAFAMPLDQGAEERAIAKALKFQLMGQRSYIERRTDDGTVPKHRHLAPRVPLSVTVNGKRVCTREWLEANEPLLVNERQAQVERFNRRVGRMRNGQRFSQPRDAEGFKVTVTTGDGIACSTARLTPGQGRPVLMCDALIEAERNVRLVLAIWRYEGV